MADDLNRPGSWLCHYTKAATTFEYILPTGQLRMSPYRRMRDPAENKDLVLSASVYGDRPEATGAWLEALGRVKRVRDGMRLLSLTRDDAEPVADRERTFACCWARPRMWEHYAERHRGVCLVFRRDPLIRTLRAELNSQGVHYLGDVRYTRAGIAGSQALRLDDDRIFSDDGAERAQASADHVERHTQDLFFLKTDDWTSEFEYRAVLLAPDDEFAFVNHRDSLVAVVVGEEFPHWHEAGARDVCSEAGVELHKIQWQQGRPRCVRLSPSA